jgi:hypothetical protein
MSGNSGRFLCASAAHTYAIPAALRPDRCVRNTRESRTRAVDLRGGEPPQSASAGTPMD